MPIRTEALAPTALLLLALCSPFARAQSVVVFDNFGPGDSYLGSGVGVSPTFQYAVAFTVGETSLVLDRFDLALSSLFESPNVFTLTVMSATDGLPGSALASQTIEGAMQSFGAHAPPVRVSFANGPLLNAGQQYWFAASSPNSLAWHWKDPAGPVVHAARVPPGEWYSGGGNLGGAYRILATPVPEPSSLMLLALGSVGLFVGLRGSSRRR